MKTKVATAIIIAALTTLAACNTIHGAGKDVSSAGNAVSNAAK